MKVKLSSSTSHRYTPTPSGHAAIELTKVMVFPHHKDRAAPTLNSAKRNRVTLVPEGQTDPVDIRVRERPPPRSSQNGGHRIRGERGGDLDRGGRNRIRGRSHRVSGGR